jgi:dienelactone hydrolase
MDGSFCLSLPLSFSLGALPNISRLIKIEPETTSVFDRDIKPDGHGAFGCCSSTWMLRINNAQQAMANQLVKNGYVALIVDSFSRGFSGVCRTPKSGSKLGTRHMMPEYLPGLPYVDSKRIALMGWSHGAISALEAVNGANREDFPKEENRRFRAVVAFYPVCSYVSRPRTFDVDVLLMIGDRDDWALPMECESMIKGAESGSRPVDYVVYPGATHSFDVDQPSKNYKGHYLEYNPRATKDSVQKTMQFLKKHL